MSFVTDLENEIARITGSMPCRDDNTLYYYEIQAARRIGCCISVDVMLHLRGCIEDIFIKLMQLDTRSDWSFSLDTDYDNPDFYDATMLINEIIVRTNSDSVEAKGLIKSAKIVLQNITKMS